MAQGTPAHKVILCGEYGVGKSSLFRRFLDNSFTTETGPRSTIGLDHFSKTFKHDEDSIKLDLWDTAGIERFATLSASYFQSTSAALLCFSIVDRESFSILSHHMLDIIMHSENAKIFLCGNKVDLKGEEQVLPEDIDDFQLQLDTVLSGTYWVSCKTGDGIKEMFQDISKILLREAAQKFDPSKIQPRAIPPSMEMDKKGCCS